MASFGTQVPPWLQASPALYLRAIEAGTDAGLGMARVNQADRELASRRNIALAELAQQGGLAAERLAQTERLAAMEDATKREIEGGKNSRLDRQFDEGLSLREARLALDRDRAKGLDEYRDARLNQFDEGLGMRAGQAAANSAAVIDRELARAEATAKGLVEAAKAINAEKAIDPNLKIKANAAAVQATTKAKILRERLRPSTEPERVNFETEEQAAAPGGSQSSSLPILGTWRDGKFVISK